jgi:hypothetical protein
VDGTFRWRWGLNLSCILLSQKHMTTYRCATIESWMKSPLLTSRFLPVKTITRDDEFSSPKYRGDSVSGMLREFNVKQGDSMPGIENIEITSLYSTRSGVVHGHFESYLHLI